MRFDSYNDPKSEGLLRAAQSRHDDAANRSRLLKIEAGGALIFLAAALSFAVLAPFEKPLSATALVVCVVTFLVAKQAEFPVGSASTCPTQLAFVPMLFVLPLPLVPLVIGGCLVLALVLELRKRKLTLSRVLTRIGDAFYSLGPAVLLFVTGDGHFRFGAWPVYLAALLVQMTLDNVWGSGRTWIVERIPPWREPQLVELYVADACLSCTGLLVTAAVVSEPAALVLMIPLIVLLDRLADERQQRLDELLHTIARTADLLGDVTEADDAYTGMHSRDVVEMCRLTAQRLGLDEVTKLLVRRGALLHDIGKIRVPKEIINKPGKLDESEWEIMKLHTVYGEELLKDYGGALAAAGKVVRASHERYDGGGYPDGLAGEDIPLPARIVSVCDSFSAMTTNRSYRQAMAIEEAVEELRRCSGTHFDPQVVQALIEVLAEDGALDARPELVDSFHAVPKTLPTAA